MLEKLLKYLKNTKSKTKNNLFFLLRVSIGIVILLSLVYFVGVEKLVESLKATSWGYTPAIIFLYLLFLAFSTVCIGLLVTKHIDFLRLFRHTTMAWVYGLVLPSKLGELSLVYFLKKEGIDTGESIIVVVIDKLITIIFFMIIALFGFFVFFDVKIAIYLNLIFISGLITLIILLKTKKLLILLTPKKYKQTITQFLDRYQGYVKNNKRRIFFNFLFTIIRWIIYTVISLLVFISLGYNISVVSLFIINVITSLTSLIPLTINGLGIRQSVGIYMFAQIGVDVALSLNMYLILLSMTYIIALFLYIYYSFIKKVKF